MQTSHSQDSAPASSLCEKVKELGQKTPHYPSGTAAFLFPRPMHNKGKSWFVRDGKKGIQLRRSQLPEAQMPLKLN